MTAVLTVLQYPFPQVRLALWRDPGALAAGHWWRLVTPLFVQYDAVWQIVVVFACIVGVGVLAERRRPAPAGGRPSAAAFGWVCSREFAPSRRR